MTNCDLLLDNQSINLRMNLIENFDFVAVPSIIWKYLYSWYSADWSISRTLVTDTLNCLDISICSKNESELSGEATHEYKKLTLDLYPRNQK